MPPDTIDARRFEQLVAQARDIARSEPETARTLLLEAETLWNGEPLAGLPGQWAHGIRTKLLERRRLAMLDRIDLDLRVGRHDDALSELTALTAGTGPVDEHVVGLKLRALAALGRRVQALEEFRHIRTRLRSEVGTEPGPDLQAIFQRILNGDRTGGIAGGIRMSDEDTPPPDTLDRDPPLLVGRDADLAGLLAAVDRDLHSRSGIALQLVHGMPGIGKTVLAVRAAHMLREACPDGQLQINLHAYRQPRLSPREALTQLLDSIGASPRELGRAGSVDALAAMWRRRIQGKRLLVLLDDVWDADQIEPLLPTTPGCVVLMTSRNRLSDIAGLRQHTLNVLPDEATLTLLNEITGRDFSGQDDDLVRFSARCGGLPLAIKVYAGRLDRRPTWNLHDLLARLTPSGQGTAENGMTIKIHEAFAGSYYALSSELRTFLCRLAAHPGPDLGPLVAAALGDVDPGIADRALDALVGHHLVEDVGEDRYRMHDLLRTFAQRQAWHEQRSRDLVEAVERVVNLYAAACTQADSTLHPFRVQTAPVPVAGSDLIAADTRAGVRSWLDAERANLTAVANFAVMRTWTQPAATLVHVLVGHLDRRGSWPQALEILEHAHSAWMPQLDSASTTAAQLLTDLAAVHSRTADLDRALSFAHAALDSWTASEDIYGEAEVLLQFGRIYWRSGRRTEAVEAYEKSAEMFARASAPDREAYARYHLAIGLSELGRTDEAFAYCRSAVATARALDDTELLSDGLINLGNALLLAGRHDEARACLVEAEPLTPARDNPLSRAVLANNFGSIQQHAGDHHAALVSFRTALHLARMTGDRQSESESLVKMATTHVCLHDHNAARAELIQASGLAADMQDPLVQSQIDIATGRLLEDEGHQPEAVQAYRASVAHAEAADVPLDQANALRALGEALAGIDRRAAREHLLRAQSIFRRLRHPDANLIDVEET